MNVFEQTPHNDVLGKTKQTKKAKTIGSAALLVTNKTTMPSSYLCLAPASQQPTANIIASITRDKQNSDAI